MDAIINLLSPEQVDAILAVYGTVADWYAQAADYVSAQVSIINEDIFM